MNKLLILFSLFVLALTGCANLGEVEDIDSAASAGISSLRTETIVGDAEDVKLGTDYRVVMGKEYESFGFTYQPGEGEAPPTITISATGVKAFEGQKSAHAALVQIRRSITEQNTQISEDTLGALDALIDSLNPLPGIP